MSIARGTRFDLGRRLLMVYALTLIATGIGLCVVAATIVMTPAESHYLGMNRAQLCRVHNCHIVQFMQHDRYAFAVGAMGSGILYLWLCASPLRRREAWAWWTMTISSALAFASFLSFVRWGYFDALHAAGVALLAAFYALGAALSFGGLDSPRSLTSLARPGQPAWLWSQFGRGRACLALGAAGIAIAGLVIEIVAMTSIFVPQDLAFMHVHEGLLHAINPHLVPLIAHDRAQFGAGLMAIGTATLGIAWCGLRVGDRTVWWVVLASGSSSLVTVFASHFAIGYDSLTHLAPPYIAAFDLALALWILHRPQFATGADAQRTTQL